MKPMLRCLFLALALALSAAGAGAKDYEVVTRPNLEFVQHDGMSLAGDLYLPKGLDKAPVVIAADGRAAAARPTDIGDRSSPATAMRCSRSTIGSARPAPIRAASTTSRRQS